MATLNSLANRLKNLNEIEGVTVTTRGQTIHVRHAKEHSLDFRFTWSNDHFRGHFVDANNNASQAVISLYEDMDAIYFAAAYAQLLNIRAGRRT